MNWEAISAIGQMLGSVAVVVALLSFRAQLRQAQRDARRAADETFFQEGRELMLSHMGNERLSKVYLKFHLALGAQLPPFSRELVAQHGANPEEAILLFQDQMTHWLRHQRMIERIEDLSEENRRTLDNLIRAVWSYPMARLFLETQRATLQPRAVAYVEALLARAEAT